MPINNRDIKGKLVVCGILKGNTRIKWCNIHKFGHPIGHCPPRESNKALVIEDINKDKDQGEYDG